MASPPDPASNNGTSTKNASLKAGLAALKRRDYPEAIAYLERVDQSQSGQSTAIKAQMGLVVAYERTGEPQKAIALCQALSNSTDAEAQAWATHTLASLKKRHPQLLASTTPSSPAPVETNPTGFMPFAGSPPPPAGTRQAVPQPASSPSAAVPDPASLPTQASQRTPEPSTGEVASTTLQSPLQAFVEAGTETAAPSTPAADSQTPPSPEPEWRNAGRAQRWGTLGPVKLARLWLVQVGTAIAVFWVIRALLRFGMGITNWTLVRTPYMRPIQVFYRDPAHALLLILIVLLCLLPWLMDGLLRFCYRAEGLPMEMLATASPEASRVLQRFCRQQGLSVPKLGILPTAAPLAFTYGNWPRFARIVVSQGLLDQLAEDEIATVYASELGHIVRRDFVLMSWIMLVAQIPYTLYWKLAQAGDWLQSKSDRAQGNNALSFYALRVVAYLVAVVSALSYGVYWLIRWPALWLSRLRTYYSDRTAAEITGNPNGFSRALLKIAIGTADDIQAQEQTSYLLEGFDLLTPLGHRMALSLGSVYPRTSFESVLEWDRLNPYRQWLMINNSHPLTGDRLQILALYARHWRLETELNFDKLRQPEKSQNRAKAASWQHWQPLLLQGAPFFGVLLGLALGLLLWLIGGLGILLQSRQMAWLWGDRLVLASCLPVGIGLGALIRINILFPDIKPSAPELEPPLPTLLANPTALPLDTQPIHWQGRLLGRPGISNWLGQDLILRTATGLIKLHHFSPLGPIGSLWPQSTRPNDLVGRVVTAAGWFRRGATAWIDLETLRSAGGRTSRSHHPLWSTLLACAAVLWGVYLISTGGY